MLEEPVGSRNQVFALLQHIATGRREPHQAGAAKQQLPANELLELLDPFGNDRFRHAELACCLGEAARLADSDERLKVSVQPIEPHHRLSSSVSSLAAASVPRWATSGP